MVSKPEANNNTDPKGEGGGAGAGLLGAGLPPLALAQLALALQSNLQSNPLLRSLRAG